MASSAEEEIATELHQIIRVYKSGLVERLMDSPTVPATPRDPETGVSSKDATISLDPSISARLYLPLNPTQKLPVLVYFHGGGFCFESAFRFLHHRYLNHLVSRARVLAVSVEYRLAPENPLPAAYEDSWTALQWVASREDPWLPSHGDFGRVYLGGDSAGANIVHNIAIKAGSQSLPGGLRILGAYMSHPYFWSSEPIGSEPVEGFDKSSPLLCWNLVYPNAPGGVDNPMINPKAPGAPKLDGLGCKRLILCVAGKDLLRERGVWYLKAVRESGWEGEAEFFEVEGEDHAFHIVNFGTENANIMIQRIASFLV